MSIPIQECPQCGFVTPCKCEKRKNPTYGQFLAEGKLDEPTTPAPTPWSAKSEAYWHGQYQLMLEKYYKQMGENSQRADRIVQLEAALDAMVEGVARKTDSQQADRIRELEEHSTKQDFLIDELVDSLRAMVAHCEGFISNLKEGK